MRKTRAIAAGAGAMSPQEVYRALLTSAVSVAPGSHKVSRSLHDRVIQGTDGTPLFRIRHQQDAIALLLPADRTSARTLAAIQHAVEGILNASAMARPGVEETNNLEVAI